MPFSGKAKSSTKEVELVWWDVRRIHWAEGWNTVGKVREESRERRGCPCDGSPSRKVLA